MGYYIQGPASGKAQYLVEQFAGKIVEQPHFFSDVPKGEELVVVVDNGPFEAAAWAFSKREFEEFTDQSDARPKLFVLVPEEKLQSYFGEAFVQARR